MFCDPGSPAFSESSKWEDDWNSEEEELKKNQSSWAAGWGSDEEDDPEAREEEQRKKRRAAKRRRVAAGSAGGGTVDFGTNCHVCRGKTSGGVQFVTCARCPLRFCGCCLHRKHGEDAVEESEAGVQWTCPLCRGGCGPGCTMNCCVCAPCRKNQELAAVGQILPAAQKAGFTNAHDYLVHFVTGESPEAIARRKEGRGWTKSTAVTDSAEPNNPAWIIKKARNARKRTGEGWSKATYSVVQSLRERKRIPNDAAVLDAYALI